MKRNLMYNKKGEELLFETENQWLQQCYLLFFN